MTGFCSGRSVRICSPDVWGIGCRRHRISQATFDKRKAKFGGLEVSDARKLEALPLGEINI